MGPLALAWAGMATFAARVREMPGELQGTAVSQPLWLLRKAPFLGVCAALLVFLGFLTWRQTAEYRDLNALYTTTLKENPGCWMAYYNLGIVLSEQGETDQAIDRYSACLSVIPDQPEAEYNLASALLRKGRIDEAIVHYQKALQLRPKSADIHANLGSALLAKARVRDAMAEYTKALQISPENVAALSN